MCRQSLSIDIRWAGLIVHLVHGVHVLAILQIVQELHLQLLLEVVLTLSWHLVKLWAHSLLLVEHSLDVLEAHLVIDLAKCLSLWTFIELMLCLGVTGIVRAILLGEHLLTEHFHKRGLNGLHLDLLGGVDLLLMLKHGIEFLDLQYECQD